MEKRAIHDMARVLKSIWIASGATRDMGAEPVTNLHALYNHHASEPEDTRFNLIAIDVYHFHLASQANMYAAMSWTFVNLLTKSEAKLDRVIEEQAILFKIHGMNSIINLELLQSTHLWLDSVIQESLRIAQQSITLRKVIIYYMI